MMIMLKRDVAGIGHAGDVKEVADGHARNFLIPRGLAELATHAAVVAAETRRGAQDRQIARLDEQRRALATKIGESQVVIKARAGAQGRLHGSITAAHVADELTHLLGETIDKREIELAEPIKQVGTHSVDVRLARYVTAKLTVVIEADA